MNSILIDPIQTDWAPSTEETGPAAPPTATASDVNSLLAQREIGAITPDLVPFLAAAAAELALVADISWRFSVDDAPVALLRLIAKVTLTAPESTGAHTARLYEQLR